MKLLDFFASESAYCTSSVCNPENGGKCPWKEAFPKEFEFAAKEGLIGVRKGEFHECCAAVTPRGRDLRRQFKGDFT